MVTVASDTLIAALSSRQDVSGACFSLILTCIFFSLSGYLASGVTGERRQGLVAGLIAAVLVALLDALMVQLLPRQDRGVLVYLLGVFDGLVLNVPFGAAFGYVGGRFGAPEE